MRPRPRRAELAPSPKKRLGEAGAADPGGYFGLSFGGTTAPTIPVMTPIRSAVTSRKFGGSTGGGRGGSLFHLNPSLSLLP
jgi:hypothetical protein